MKKITTILFTLIGFLSFSQVVHYTWPTAPGEALLSDKYQVFIQHGSDPEEEVEVLMSVADPNDIQYDFRTSELTGRTFSFASISYNNIGSAGLNFRIVKTFGNTSTSVSISPKSYNIVPTVTNNQVTFSINDKNKFISINFEDTENETSSEKWIKHMLTIFVDPPETGAPNPTDPGVVTYSNSLSPTALANASIIYFPPGYHNLDDYPFGNAIIDFEGKITLKNGQKIYLAGGAFVEGLVLRNNFNDTNQKLYGRGILSGRQYPWQDGLGNKPYGQIVELGKFAEVNGVHIIDSPNHGIVSPNNMTITNLKFLGWHANNDAVRVGQDSEIKDSFIRAVDDFFYNFDNYVHDCVLWAGHNGAVLTYGWGGDGGNTYNSGGSTMENIDIINPEWTGLGNNNGLVASQVGLDYKPFPYNNGTTLTTLSDIRIEGSIPGILNLKPRSSGSGVPNAIQVPVANLGYLGDLLLENITVENQFAKGRIRGQANATTTGSNTFFVQDVTLTNVTIGGTELNTVSAPIFFDIETSTTQNINFDMGSGSSSSSLEIEDFQDVSITHLTSNFPNQSYQAVSNTEIQNIPVGTGRWFSAGSGGGADFGTQPSGGNPTNYLSRITSTEFAKGAVYVFNNTGGDAFGILDMSFDYFWKSPLTNDRIAYRVWGINDNEANGVNGYFRLTGGSGPFGDNDSTNYLGGSDATELASNLELGIQENWTTVNYIIDATQYEYIAIAFAGAFQVSRTNPESLFGIDNVTIPVNRTLSNKTFSNNNKLSFYPNPVNSIINLQNIKEPYTYNIYDISGKVLKANKNQSHKTIDISYLSKGIYLLEVETGGFKSTAKIIKM